MREACWQLRRPADIPALLQTLYEELKAIFPQLDHCSVQLVEEDTGQWEAYAVSATQTRQQESRAVPGAAATLLVVEDEARLLRLAQTMLESLGYTVLAAATPEAALCGGPRSTPARSSCCSPMW